MCHFRSFESTSLHTPSDRTDVTVYVSNIPCPRCNQPMEARKGQDQVQTNARGESRVIKAYAVLTCKNVDCDLYYQTFDERSLADGVDLSLYVKAVR